VGAPWLGPALRSSASERHLGSGQAT